MRKDFSAKGSEPAHVESKASKKVAVEPKTQNIWLRPVKPTRAELPVSRNRIVQEAVSLLDQEGIKGLTMRRLAERLDTGAATLYWHVKTREDVLDLAFDEVFGEVLLPTEQDGHWRKDIRQVILGWRNMMIRHPWSAALSGHPLIGPNVLARMEFIQATLLRAGFDKAFLSAATWSLCNFTMGSATALANWHMRTEEREIAHEFLNIRKSDYPTLASEGYILNEDWDGDFVRGLDCLLDGIEAHLTRP